VLLVVCCSENVFSLVMTY